MASYLKDAQTTHAGVAVANWAGEFECCVCKRKRLTAAEFSKKMQEKRRIDEKASVKCKRCVEAEAEAERDAAAAKAKPAGAATQDAYVCAACEKKLPASEFTKNQIVKGPTKQRCSPCVAKASTEDADASAAKQADALKQAREAFKRAEAGGSVAEKLVAASKLSALEGELVTGLKPVCLGKRGRGRGGGGKSNSVLGGRLAGRGTAR
ncbi:hypothetical protein M885DRAFT_538873 [Pelagophyceae sp. CCMP2097]|nr:hypothetical protein M885DRAFT_538873 [Pelagophyceae sp. CCMP2097]